MTELNQGTKTFALWGSNYSTEEQEPLPGPPSPTLPGHHSPSLGQSPAACPSATLALARATQPSPEGLTCRVAQQWPQGRHASPPRGQGSHLLSLLPIPQGLTRLQMRSSHLDPKEGRRLYKAPLPSSAKAKTLGIAAGTGEAKDSIPSQTETVRPREGLEQSHSPPEGPEWSRKGLWARLPAQSSIQPSLLGWKLGSSFGGMRVKVLKEYQEAQPATAVPHNAPTPAGMEAAWSQ